MHFYYFAWKSTFFLCYYPLIMNVEFRRFLVVNVVWMLLVLHTHQSFIDAHKSFRPFLRPLFGRQHPPTLFFATENSKRNSSKNNPESIWTTLPHYSKKLEQKRFSFFWCDCPLVFEKSTNQTKNCLITIFTFCEQSVIVQTIQMCDRLLKTPINGFRALLERYKQNWKY